MLSRSSTLKTSVWTNWLWNILTARERSTVAAKHFAGTHLCTVLSQMFVKMEAGLLTTECQREVQGLSSPPAASSHSHYHQVIYPGLRAQLLFRPGSHILTYRYSLGWHTSGRQPAAGLTTQPGRYVLEAFSAWTNQSSQFSLLWLQSWDVLKFSLYSPDPLPQTKISSNMLL